MSRFIKVEAMVIEDEEEEEDDDHLDYNWEEMGLSPPEEEEDIQDNKSYHFRPIYINKTRITTAIPVEHQGIKCCQIILLGGQPYLTKGGEELYDKLLDPNQ